jgi:hypothetical protein
VNGALGAAAGGIVGSQLLGGGGSKQPGPQDSPYYKPQMDANGNPITMRSGRGAKALSV